MEKRESTSWLIALVMTIVTAVVGYIAWHADFAKVDDVRGLGAAVLVIIKDDQRARKKWYDQKSEEELTPADREQQIIIEHNIKNIDNVGEVLGLDSDDG